MFSQNRRYTDAGVFKTLFVPLPWAEEKKSKTQEVGRGKGKKKGKEKGAINAL